MAQSNPRTHASQLNVAGSSEKTTINSEPKTIRVQSLIDSHLTYYGRATGVKYVWPRAGSIVVVAEADLSNLLEKRLGGNSCCGGGSADGNKMFQIAVE